MSTSESNMPSATQANPAARTYHGFIITPLFQSSTTGRMCASIQGYRVTHPAGNEKSPCGWHGSLRDSKADIDECVANSKLSAVTMDASRWSVEYLRLLASWFPACAAADALVLREIANKKREAERTSAQREEERAQRIAEAAPDLLAALRECAAWIKAELDGRLPVEALANALAAIAKAEGA